MKTILCLLALVACALCMPQPGGEFHAETSNGKSDGGDGSGAMSGGGGGIAEKAGEAAKHITEGKVRVIDKAAEGAGDMANGNIGGGASKVATAPAETMKGDAKAVNDVMQ